MEEFASDNVATFLHLHDEVLAPIDVYLLLIKPLFSSDRNMTYLISPVKAPLATL